MTRIIVTGGLNTDIIASGVETLLGSGQLTRSGKLVIGSGGKSRNIAQMTAALTGPDEVAMIGRTSRDPFGLWEIPLRALKEGGVNTDFIKVSDFEETGLFPGVALIPVNTKGENQIYCLPGINDQFSPDDIEEAGPVFEIVGENKGLLALTLEQPLATAVHAVRKAGRMQIGVVLDPGGLEKDKDYGELLNENILLIKPNEHEAEILTGIPVTDMSSARKAAGELLRMGVINVVITNGRRGAYVFSKGIEIHVPVPPLPPAEVYDETGCGDQVTAVLCAELLLGHKPGAAARSAVRAGTLQYARAGIQALTLKELADYERRSNSWE